VGNPDWSAHFLYKDGAEQPGARQCPRTLAALEAAPLTRIPKRTPSILFSKLAAGAHIPPHTGMLNARLICHLPLIVPAGCEFRVGNNVRAWSEGQAWVFDDTIEHEAWNRSSQDRYILIFDIWRPELSEEERAAVTALCEAIDAYRGDTPWDA
jgi:aspartyl/asparaginyl beta-hydroxylase (cupin superfamily)